jgi:hypothetical protein
VTHAAHRRQKGLQIGTLKRQYMMVRGLNEIERRYASEKDARLQAFLDGRQR